MLGIGAGGFIWEGISMGGGHRLDFSGELWHSWRACGTCVWVLRGEQHSCAVRTRSVYVPRTFLLLEAMPLTAFAALILLYSKPGASVQPAREAQGNHRRRWWLQSPEGLGRGKAHFVCNKKAGVMIITPACYLSRMWQGRRHCLFLLGTYDNERLILLVFNLPYSAYQLFFLPNPSCTCCIFSRLIFFISEIWRIKVV